MSTKKPKAASARPTTSPVTDVAGPDACDKIGELGKIARTAWTAAVGADNKKTAAAEKLLELARKAGSADVFTRACETAERVKPLPRAWIDAKSVLKGCLKEGVPLQDTFSATKKLRLETRKKERDRQHAIEVMEAEQQHPGRAEFIARLQKVKEFLVALYDRAPEEAERLEAAMLELLTRDVTDKESVDPVRRLEAATAVLAQPETTGQQTAVN